MTISQPWPREYEGWKSGAHDIPEPEPVTEAPMAEQPVTWAQLRDLLANAADLSEAAKMADAVAQASPLEVSSALTPKG